LATVVPFRALRYNTARFGKDISRFVSPPYDVIDKVMAKRLKDDRLNITHVTLGDEGDSYTVAARRLRRWIEDEVLVQEADPCFFVYEQTFSSPDGTPRVRSGIVALVKLEDFSRGIVLPHEKTIPKHMADRMELMCAVEGDTEQIFLLYDDPSGDMEWLLLDTRKRDEVMRFVDPEGVHHRLIKICEPGLVDKIRKLLEPAKLLIADGHHRYATALEYRDKMRAKDGSKEGEMPYDYILATLVSFRNPGLIIYPTYRLIQKVDDRLISGLPKALEEEFELRALESLDDLATAVEKSSVRAFGVWIPSSKSYLLATTKSKETPKNPLEELPVYIVQERVLKRLLGYTSEMIDTKINIEYVKGTGPTKDAMETGEYQACFFVKPPSVQQVMAIAETGQLMPHKSTYFFPKIWSGAVLYLFKQTNAKTVNQ
jgi:uncharacterized protein (DUF1015 family)